MAQYLSIPKGITKKVSNQTGVPYERTRYLLLTGDYDTWQVAFEIIEKERAQQNEIRERLSQLEAA